MGKTVGILLGIGMLVFCLVACGTNRVTSMPTPEKPAPQVTQSQAPGVAVVMASLPTETQECQYLAALFAAVQQQATVAHDAYRQATQEYQAGVQASQQAIVEGRPTLQPVERTRAAYAEALRVYVARQQDLREAAKVMRVKHATEPRCLQQYVE